MGFLGKLFGGGGGAKTDRSQTLQGYGDLQSAFNFGLDNSKQLTSTGTGDISQGKNILGDPLKYWQTLLRGDRTQTAAAIAPESNATLARADATKRQAETIGTARGGGVAGENRTIDDRTRAELDNYLFGVRPAAAGEVGKIGGEFADIGTKEIGEGLGFGGLAESSASGLTNASIAERQQNLQQNKNLLSTVTGGIESILGAIF